ncbi:MAG: diaminopimelate decarboxylase [Clostridia bacterium]|nr:diaminopimelate decarboxylase [Clostridia bacterium]
MLSKNINVNAEGHLTFAGVDTVALANKYGTPLYLIDEDGIVERVREYKNAMKGSFSADSEPCFAGKALCYTDLYRTLEKENMWIDVVSPGEFYTAKNAGFDLSRAMFHGNNKTDADLEMALKMGVGRIVVDNGDEAEALERIAGEMGVKAPVILRLTPGIDPHTLKAINTGTVDSKFGVAIETGDAEKLVKKVLSYKNITLYGYHCHIGSQVFDCIPFIEASDRMFAFSANIRDKYGFEAPEINLGGGMAVKYLESDPEISYTKNISDIGEHIKMLLKRFSLKMPRIFMEPGRSIVADSGMTLYTVGSVKCIENYKNYVSVDGGMADNPRYALYNASYTLINASFADKTPDFEATVGGRCCESGDLIQERVKLVRPKRGDVLAVCTTGAYNFSMSSNYNRLLRPALVSIKGGEDRLSVKRETFEDLVRNDI